MDESTGIIMFNCGTEMIIRALVALYSIRKHYNGAITFYVEDPCPIEFEQALRGFNCDVVHLQESKDHPLIKKTMLFSHPPYDKNIFLDLDVIVVDKIDEMFNALSEVNVCIPHFEEKYTSNIKENLCSARVKKYQGYMDDTFIQVALNNHEAINTGVMCFKRSLQWEKFVGDWIKLARRGIEIKAPIVDETSFQVIYPSIDKWDLKIKILPGNYNIYVLSNKNYDNPKIYHFCGNKHCTSDTPLSAIWKNTFEEMRKNNAANINSFLHYADKRLGEYLKGNPVFHKKENKINSPKITEPTMSPTIDNKDIPKPINIAKAKKIDQNDDSAFRHIRNRNEGSANNEFRQTVPFFFTREGAAVDLIGQYKGASAFLICNGPSFVKLDRKLLDMPGIMTFGINNGPKTFRPNFWTCVDDPVRFLKSIWLDPKITKFIPQSHFEKPIFDNEKWEVMRKVVGDCPNVIGYRRNEKFVASQWLYEDKLNWGNHKDHGGGRSVMLPSLRILHLLGFRKVYLLGCDMKMTEQYTYHFDEQRSKGAVNCNMSTYDRLKSEYLPQLKPYFDAEGFNVFNCNSESELKVFPFISFEEAIKEATKSLGNVPNERVWGMYSTPEEKPQWKEEPSEENKAHLKTLKQLEAKSNGWENPEISRASIPITPKLAGTVNHMPPQQMSTGHSEIKSNQILTNSVNLPVDGENEIKETPIQ